jgi:hypothetical protein
VVVKVIREEPVIRKNSLSPINAAFLSPSQVIFRNFHSKITVPDPLKILKIKVNINKNQIVFKPFIIYLKGTPDSLTTANKPMPAITKPRNV